MKRSVASCFMFISSMDSKNPNCQLLFLRRRHDNVLAARELADASGLHLSVDLPLPLPCTQCLRVQGKGADGPQYATGLIGTIEA